MAAGGAHPFAGCLQPFAAYEIHLGRSRIVGEGASELFTIVAAGSEEVPRNEGATSASGRVWGTYLHGLFEADELRFAWLRRLGWSGHGRPFGREAAHRRWAAHVLRHVDIERIEGFVTGSCETAPVVS
jgi:adenosylcobyric acid synthase